MRDVWLSYECDRGCYTPSGVVVDVRLPTVDVLAVRCPVCDADMRFRGSWAASEAGFGSRGDQPGPASDVVDAWLSGMADLIEEGCRLATSDANAAMQLLSQVPSCPGDVSYGALVDELRRRVQGRPPTS